MGKTILISGGTGAGRPSLLVRKAHFKPPFLTTSSFWVAMVVLTMVLRVDFG
jgi:hypothetical protein